MSVHFKKSYFRKNNTNNKIESIEEMKINIKKNIVIYLIILLFFVLIVLGLKHYYTESSNIIENNLEKNNINKDSEYLSNHDLAYSSNRADYESDEQFSNFRLLEVGKMKPIIYRGASPVDNAYNRVQITDALLKKYNIKYIINLVDNEKEFNNYINCNNLSNSYTNLLYKQNNIYFGNLSIQYETQEYAENMAKALMQITRNEGPFYIHCTHGRDRTGMACIILEALADASYTEILNDYMETYQNYNSVNKKTNSQKYKAIFDSRFKNAIYYITKDKYINDYSSYNYKKAVKEFLRYGGLTELEIDELESALNP